MIHKIIANSIGLVRGFFVKILNSFNKKRNIGRGLRYFSKSHLYFYKKCKCNIGNNVKIDYNTTIVVCNNSILEIGDNVGIGPNNRIITRKKISIGNNTILGPNVLVYDHDHVFDKDTGVKKNEYVSSEISIGMNCWIGANVIILKGSKIGDNCLIAAGSIVTEDVPTGTTFIQKRKSEFIKGE